ncbi:MAG TPA: AMP-binding protein [Rectinemataceae bacterium]|nr:AMP-binding protein [Rectinemataceae bacterium]
MAISSSSARGGGPLAAAGFFLGGRHVPAGELEAFCRDSIAGGHLPPWEEAALRFILDWLGPEESIVQRSSGTTGRPKDLVLAKTAMAGSARNTCDFFGLKPGDSALLCLPVDYIAGKMMIARALVGGLDLLITEPSGRPPIPRRRVDFCAMVPLQVEASLAAGPELGRIGTLIIGGAEISPELEKALGSETVSAWATYGMAETCSQVALRRVNGDRPEKVYTAMRGVRLSLDERDCLAIEADWLGGKVQTNDVVEMLDDLRFRWLGRFDNLINSGGLKIVPEELEALITEKTGRACAVIGLPDTRLGTKVAVVFEDGATGSTSELASLRGLLEGELPRQALPREILAVAELPRNASFKLDRKRLAALLGLG